MRPSGWTAGVALVAGLAGVVRLWVAEWTFPVRLIGDEIYYLRTAESIARGGGHYFANFGAWAAWPPGNAWWLSHFVPSEGTRTLGAPHAALLGQVALGTLLVVLTAWLGRELFGQRTGLWAGTIAALYPSLVAFSHYFWAATLFAVLLLSSLIGVVVAQRRRSAGVAAATGAVFGLAALTREASLPIAAGCALWWLWLAPAARRRATIARCALMLGVALLVVTPWTVRNHARLGQLVPVSNAGWLALLHGNALDADDWLEPDYRRRAALTREYRSRAEPERPAWAREQALELIRAEQPWWAFKKLVLNPALLFRPDSFIFRKLAIRAYGDVTPWLSRTLMLITMVAHIAVMTLAILSGVTARERGRPSFMLAVVAPLVGVHVLAFASARYRVPLMPIFIIYAAHLMRNSRGLLDRLRGPQSFAAALLLLFFFAVCIPHFYANGLLMWETGSYFE